MLAAVRQRYIKEAESAGGLGRVLGGQVDYLSAKHTQPAIALAAGYNKGTGMVWQQH